MTTPGSSPISSGPKQSRAEIAETLQHGLLPPPLPHIPGWSIAASYRPAGAENEVGGDFYDAFPAAGGWMLVVGDVTGRGAQAAAITAQARYTLRTAAVLTGDPLVAISTLNRALLARGGSALCSVAALAVSEDPLQPVRTRGSRTSAAASDRRRGGHASSPAPGPVLGAFADANWALEQAVIDPGQQLVVVTDGIAEAAGRAAASATSGCARSSVGVGEPGPGRPTARRRSAGVHRRCAGRRRRDPRAGSRPDESRDQAAGLARRDQAARRNRPIRSQRG